MAKDRSEWQIRFYEEYRGRSPVLEFINRLPTRDKAKITNTLRLLEEFGTRLGMPHARPIEGKLWELRPGGNRLFLFLIYRQNIRDLTWIQETDYENPRS
jgi:hypothetical protein